MQHGCINPASLNLNWFRCERLHDNLSESHSVGVTYSNSFVFQASQDPEIDWSNMSSTRVGINQDMNAPASDDTRMNSLSDLLPEDEFAAQYRYTSDSMHSPSWVLEREEDTVCLSTSHKAIGYQRTAESLLFGRTQEASTSSTTRTRPRTVRQTRRSTISRNKQATADQVEKIKLLLCGLENNDLICPVSGCDFIQVNGRKPDFHRHVNTHLREGGKVCCKGVPWQDYLRDCHRFPMIPVDELPYTVPQEDGLWIGGCLKTFSRKDALQRHLNNSCCAK